MRLNTFGIASIVAMAITGPAFAQSTAAIEKDWGYLATLDGSIWTEGRDQVTEYRWEKPGKIMRLETRGLWGQTLTIIKADAATSGLVATTYNADTGEKISGTFKSTPSSYMITNTNERQICRKANVGLSCVIEVSQTKKWKVDSQLSFKSSSTSLAKELLSNIPAIFPLPQPGNYDTNLGNLATCKNCIFQRIEKNNNDILAFESDVNPASPGIKIGVIDAIGNLTAAFGFGRYDNESSMHYNIFVGSIKNPLKYDRSRPLAVARGGQLVAPMGDETVIFSLSKDKNYLLSRTVEINKISGFTEISRSLYISTSAFQVTEKSWGSLGRLAGKTFFTNDGAESFIWTERGRLSHRIYSRVKKRENYSFELSKTCTIEDINGSYRCGSLGSPRKYDYQVSNLNEKSFSIANVTFKVPVEIIAGISPVAKIVDDKPTFGMEIITLADLAFINSAALDGSKEWQMYNAKVAKRRRDIARADSNASFAAAVQRVLRSSGNSNVIGPYGVTAADVDEYEARKRIYGYDGNDSIYWSPQEVKSFMDVRGASAPPAPMRPVTDDTTMLSKTPKAVQDVYDAARVRKPLGGSGTAEAKVIAGEIGAAPDAVARRTNPEKSTIQGTVARAQALTPAGRSDPGADQRPSAKVLAHVPTPRLPDTIPPKGFFDSNQFIIVDDPAVARKIFKEMYGDNGGDKQFLTEGCYPDGAGRYNCQARVRIPLSGVQSKVQDE